MPLINGNALVYNIRNFKVVCIEGRFGGGKTALAFYLASIYLSRFGYRYLLTNCRSVWADSPWDVVLRPNEDGIPKYADAIVILDEAGLYLRYGRDADAFLSFLRKMNIILIMPSYEEVARKLRSLVVQRTMNLEVFGLPAWVYSVRLTKGEQRDKTNTIWWRPSEIFGIYDTEATPDDDAGLSLWFQETKDKLVSIEREQQKRDGIRRAGDDGKIRSSGRVVPSLEGFERGDADLIFDAAETTADAVSVLEEFSRKRRR